MTKLQDYRELLENQKSIDPEMIDVSIDFWFTSKDEIRSPFPDYIKKDLIDAAVLKFIEWDKKITTEARKEINDEILAERFEEILFEEAHKMVVTDDEKITIKYPFMLRIDDLTRDSNGIESKVIARKIKENDDTSFLHVTLLETDSGKKWETSFELFE